MTPPVLGRVVATELKPSTPHQFHFGTAPDATCGIGTIVRVDDDGRTVFAVVTEGFAYAGASQPGEIRTWSAAVLRQIPEEPLQPVPLGAVTLASDVDVRIALRMDAYVSDADSTGIPAGLYAAGGLSAPVLLDADFLLGPEAAHLNISGVSGLATKTSAVTFLLSSIFQTFPKSKGTVAAVCFNVKGPDLCFLDQAAVLGEDDLATWRRLGLHPAPFNDFTVFAPHKPDGVNLNTLRSNPAIAAAVEPLVWGLREILDFAEVVLNRDDVDAKAGALIDSTGWPKRCKIEVLPGWGPPVVIVHAMFPARRALVPAVRCLIDFLAENVIGKKYTAAELREAPFEVMNFADLDEFFRAIFGHLESKRGDEVWRTHHIATIRKVRNRLGNIATRSKGLVSDDAVANDLPWGSFRDRSMTVVDVAGVDPLAQDLVFARVISKLREHLERRDLGVDHVVVFVDELNKYAPADGPETYVKRMLLDLSERGRYLGLVLFSAQQFRSQVLRRVTGNAGTSMYGRMDSDELAMPGYATLSPAIKAKLASLAKGELMVRHPHFTQPVFVRFPRPASLSGREGVEHFPPEPDLPFADALIRRLKALDPAVAADAVRAAIEGRPEAEVRQALSAVTQRRPDDVFAFFRGILKRTIAVMPVEPRRGIAPLARDDSDPFAPY